MKKETRRLPFFFSESGESKEKKTLPFFAPAPPVATLPHFLSPSVLAAGEGGIEAVAMRRARGLGGGGGVGRKGLAPELAPLHRGGGGATTPATTRPLPMLLAPLPPPPSTCRLRELSQRLRASTPSDPEWGPSTSGRRGDSTTRAKASSSSSSSSANSVSPPPPPSGSRSFPTSAVLASLSSRRLDEALEHVLLEALSTVEGFRDASEESWSELMRRRRPRLPLLLDDDDDDGGGGATTSSSPSWPDSSSSSSRSSSDAAAALVSSLCRARRPRDALRALRAAHALGSPPDFYPMYQELISASCRAGDVQGAMTAYRLLQRAPSTSAAPTAASAASAGLSSGLSSSAGGLFMEPNFVTTCGLISALSRASKSARRGTAAAGPRGAAAAAAHQLWRELVDSEEEDPSAASSSSSSTLLGGNLDAAAIVVGMNACVGAGEIDEAWELLRRVLRAADLADASTAAAADADERGRQGEGPPRGPAATTAAASTVRPSAPMFNVLLKGAARSGNTRLLPLVLGEMRRRGVAPTRVTLNTLVSAHARAGELDLARAALDESSRVDGDGEGRREGERGGEGGSGKESLSYCSGPDTWGLAALASGYVKAGRRREAEELYGEAMRTIAAAAAAEEERERGGGNRGERAFFAASPSARALGAAFFTTLIDGAAREGDAPGAQRWFDALLAAGAGAGAAPPPSARAFNALLRAYCAAGRGGGGGSGSGSAGASSSSSASAAAAAAAAAAALSPPRASSSSSPCPYFSSSSPSSSAAAAAAAAAVTSSVDPLSGALVGALRGADAAAAAVGGDAGGLLEAEDDDDAPGRAEKTSSSRLSPHQQPPPPPQPPPAPPAKAVSGFRDDLRGLVGSELCICERATRVTQVLRVQCCYRL